MKDFGLAVCLFLLASAANAQPIQVRSGDHEYFTRLVFPLPARSDVDYTVEAKEVRIDFSSTDKEIDVSGVFSRISNRRLRSISFSEKDDQVLISLACDCRLASFWFQENSFVLDVIDHIETSKNIETEASDITSSYPFRSKAAMGSLINLPTSRVISESFAVQTLGQFVRKRAAEKENEEKSKYTNPKPESLGSQVLAQKTRTAVKDGMQQERSDTEFKNETIEIIFGSVENEVEKEPSVGVTTQLSIRKPTELPRVQLEIKAGENSEQECLNDRELDIVSWSDGSGFTEEVSNHMARIFNERDKINSAMIYRLSLLYLHYGFGAEAVATLSLLEEPGPETDLLIAVAEVMEEGKTLHDILKEQAKCDGSSSFWGVFYGTHLDSTLELNKEALLKAFSALPRHLRRHLGPVASERLLAAGFTETSDSIASMVNRVEKNLPEDAVLTNVALDQYLGSPKIDQQQLEVTINASENVSAEIIIQSIERSISEGKEVDPNVASLSRALSFENSNSVDGEAFSKAHILALAASSQFDEAYRKLNTEDRFGDKEERNLRSTVTTLMLDRADTITVLRNIFSGNTGLNSHLSENASIRISKVLSDNGFFQEADLALNRGFSPNLNKNSRLARAQIALSMGLIAKAEANLVGLNGPIVDELMEHVAKNRAAERQNHGGLNNTIAERASDNNFSERNTFPSQTDSKSLPRESDATFQDELLISSSLLESSIEIKSELEAFLQDNPMPTN